MTVLLLLSSQGLKELVRLVKQALLIKTLCAEVAKLNRALAAQARKVRYTAIYKCMFNMPV